MIDLKIKENKDCMGCYACSSICPENCIFMDTDSEGFWYPKIDYDKCIKCGLCVKVCPIINKTEVENNPKAYACNNRDEDTRIKSSSGGIFTLVSEEILRSGGVVFGAGFNDEFDVVHSYTEKIEGIDKYRGSKYVQSKIGYTYKEVKYFLEKERKVLFTGTPCQISGLKAYLGKKYGNLVTMDNICHGVPSPKVWNIYLSYISEEYDLKIKSIDFRSKKYGWKGYTTSIKFQNDINYREHRSRDLYMRAFLKDVCLRPSCYDCKFKGINRESDITLGDFWGIKNIASEMDDDKGTSLIFVNSDVGQSILENIKDEIKYKEVDINQAVSYNTAAIKSVKYNSNRDGFMMEKDFLDFDILVDKYCTDRLKTRMKKKLRLIIKKALIHIKNLKELFI